MVNFRKFSRRTLTIREGRPHEPWSPARDPISHRGSGRVPGDFRRGPQRTHRSVSPAGTGWTGARAAHVGRRLQERSGAQGHSCGRIHGHDGDVRLVARVRLRQLSFRRHLYQSRRIRRVDTAHPACATDDRDDEHDQQELLRRSAARQLLHVSQRKEPSRVHPEPGAAVRRGDGRSQLDAHLSRHADDGGAGIRQVHSGTRGITAARGAQRLCRPWNIRRIQHGRKRISH